MTIKATLKILLIFLSDFAIIAYLLVCNVKDKLSINLPAYAILIIFLIIIIKSLAIIYVYKYIYIDKISNIKDILTEYKKGKFSYQKKKFSGKDELSKLTQDLSVIGKYIDSIVTSLKDEIKSLRELYNNIIFSITSYLLILNKRKEIIYANDIFCKKFQFELDEIAGKSIEDIFLFVAQNMKDSIDEIKNSEKSVILEKIHLLSKNWTSVIADIKISRIVAQNEEQIVLIIDDITSKCRKDYQINLISQITGSIQRDEEIHKILYTILYGITSGSGLGFNRAMLFLIDAKKKKLSGEIAVGPDSMEEAIEIWNSMPQGAIDAADIANTFNMSQRKGSKLLEKVVNAKFDIESDNVFVKSFKNMENIHIFNTWNDNNVDDQIKSFIDVAEFVVVPLIVENRPIGIIVADNKFNQVPISNDHIELLSIFAVQASLLIDSFQSVSTLKKEMDKIKNKQDAIIESEKLAAIGRISTHIAHEIRNPLVTMGGYARRIMQISDDNEKIKKAADVILKESVRLENILSNVMDLTKPQTLIKNLNNINNIIKDTNELLKNVFFEKRIRIITKLSDSLPLSNSDPNQIKQVILNLLQNAVDATPSGGEIEVATYSDESNIIIIISDTGTGIENSNLESIYEPFFTTKITGVGLGLAIVNKIIKDHNGSIVVRNKDTGGAEFTITLPINL
ncbi:MAG: ATP-binding protein [Spirochaetota bacterium]